MVLHHMSHVDFVGRPAFPLGTGSHPRNRAPLKRVDCLTSIQSIISCKGKLLRETNSQINQLKGEEMITYGISQQKMIPIQQIWYNFANWSKVHPPTIRMKLSGRQTKWDYKCTVIMTTDARHLSEVGTQSDCARFIQNSAVLIFMRTAFAKSL